MSREVDGREIAEDQGQGRPNGMIDPRPGSGSSGLCELVPVECTSWGSGHMLHCPNTLKTVLGQLTSTEPLSERCPGLCFSFSAPSHHHPLSFPFLLL